jgi:hypothetical protein
MRLAIVFFVLTIRAQTLTVGTVNPTATDLSLPVVRVPLTLSGFSEGGPSALQWVITNEKSLQTSFSASSMITELSKAMECDSVQSESLTKTTCMVFGFDGSRLHDDVVAYIDVTGYSEAHIEIDQVVASDPDAKSISIEGVSGGVGVPEDVVVQIQQHKPENKSRAGTGRVRCSQIILRQVGDKGVCFLQLNTFEKKGRWVETFSSRADLLAVSGPIWLEKGKDRFPIKVSLNDDPKITKTSILLMGVIVDNETLYGVVNLEPSDKKEDRR